MIKTIKKIDLQGDEVWQEVIVCNRCKKVLAPTDFVYETKWTAWHPVKMEGSWGCGFGEGSNPVKHICEDCQEKAEKFLNGERVVETPEIIHAEGVIMPRTFMDRVEEIIPKYRSTKTETLKEIYMSCTCSKELGTAIEIILKARNEKIK